MYDNSDKLRFTPDRSKHPSWRPRTPARATFRQSFGARGPRHAQHTPKALSAAPGGHAIGDIAEALSEVARDDLINAGPIGMDQDMHRLIPLRACEAISR